MYVIVYMSLCMCLNVCECVLDVINNLVSRVYKPNPVKICNPTRIYIFKSLFY